MGVPRDHVLRNRRFWDESAATFAELGRRAWRQEPHWGLWEVRESDLGVLPKVSGMRTIDLGCGTAYWSAWLARLGAHPIGIDNSRRQLETARVLQREHRIAFPLIHASAEEVPLRADSFDLALSEYGASIWCEPERWVAEAARVLRPGGLLIFLRNASLLMLCIPDSQGEPATDRLLRPYFGTHRIEWSGSDEVEFQPTHGEWIRLLRSCGFVIENLIEIQAPEGARAPFPYVSGDWARQWPSEEIWVARKAGR